jgi:hypothetical protein
MSVCITSATLRFGSRRLAGISAAGTRWSMGTVPTGAGYPPDAPSPTIPLTITHSI